MIIIDADFVNLAIQEVYNLYPQYSNREFDIAKFLLLLLFQNDIERPNYQISVNWFTVMMKNFITVVRF